MIALATLRDNPLGTVLSMVNVGLTTHPVAEELVNVPCTLSWYSPSACALVSHAVNQGVLVILATGDQIAPSWTSTLM